MQGEGWKLIQEKENDPATLFSCLTWGGATRYTTKLSTNIINRAEALLFLLLQWGDPVRGFTHKPSPHTHTQTLTQARNHTQRERHTHTLDHCVLFLTLFISLQTATIAAFIFIPRYHL